MVQHTGLQINSMTAVILTLSAHVLCVISSILDHVFDEKVTPKVDSVLLWVKIMLYCNM